MRRDCLVTIQAPNFTTSPDGQPIPAWATFATEFANIRNLSGIEAIKAGATASTIKTSINIRFREDITSDMRVIFGSTVYQIDAALPDYERRDSTFLTCQVVT